MNEQNNNTNQPNGDDNAGGPGLGNLDVSSDVGRVIHPPWGTRVDDPPYVGRCLAADG